MRTAVHLSSTGKQGGGGEDEAETKGREGQRETRGEGEGLRLTGAVGGWWEGADPNSLRTFDSHLEWRTQGNIQH